jgi:hypothetical protein
MLRAGGRKRERIKGAFCRRDHSCEISGFHGGEYEDACLLGYSAM